MEEGKAVTKFVRVPPRKARLAAGLIRGRGVEEALYQLMFSPLKGARLLSKTLKSAMANAESKYNLDRRDLKVKEVKVDAGPVIKRAKPRSKGSRVPVMKRTSHFTVIVGK